MTQQPSLFGPRNAYGGYDDPPLARSNDPKTSHRAAARQRSSGKINSGSAIIMAILRRIGKPSTYREVWSAADASEKEKLREPSTIATRLTVLERRGLVRAGNERLCTIGKVEARQWELIDEAPG